MCRTLGKQPCKNKLKDPLDANANRWLKEIDLPLAQRDS